MQTLVKWINVVLSFCIGFSLSIVFLMGLIWLTGYQDLNGTIAIALVLAGGIFVLSFAICSVRWQKQLMSGMNVFLQFGILIVILIILQIIGGPQPFVYVLV